MRRIVSLDILKAILSLFVIFTHSHYARSISDSFIFPYIIDLAVPCFIIMTSFFCADSIDKGRYVIKSKTKNIILPFVLIILVETAIRIIREYSIKDIISTFIFGEWGDGGYYPYILLQIYILFPVLYKIIKKYKYSAVCVICIIDIIFELLTSLGYIPTSIHRILVIRYLGMLCSGILIHEHKRTISINKVMCLLCCGIVIVFINNSFLKQNIIKYWNTTSLPVAFYASAIILIFLQLNKKIQQNKIVYYVSHFGQASYYVFIIQMIYYWLFRHLLGFSQPVFPTSMLICSILGYAYYIVFTKYLMKKSI